MSSYRRYSSYQEAVEAWMEDHRVWQNNSEDSDEPQQPNQEDWDEKTAVGQSKKPTQEYLSALEVDALDEANMEETRPPTPEIDDFDIEYNEEGDAKSAMVESPRREQEPLESTPE